MHVGSLPLSPSLLILAILLLSIICQLLSFCLHLYYRRECEKGSDVSNFLLVVLTSSVQVRNLCHTIVFISLALGYQPHWILPCSIFNLMIISGGIDNICTTLLSLIASWFLLKHSHYTSVRQCVVRRMFGFVIIILSSYPLFVTMMVCEKKAFCPEEIEQMYNPHRESVDFEKIFDDISCRLPAISLIKLIKVFAVILTTLCIIAKATCGFIEKFRTSNEPENTDMELHHLSQSAPLPPFQNTRRLHQSTIIVLLLLSLVIGVVHIAVLYTRNIFLSLCVSLALTVFVPIITILLEKRILHFCLTFFLKP